MEVAERGGSCGAVVNAANEAAVELFLQGEIKFLKLSPVVGEYSNITILTRAPSSENLCVWMAGRERRSLSGRHFANRRNELLDRVRRDCGSTGAVQRRGRP
ncbi:MAG: hypothetical protein R3C56_43055 [Pirellulaceae bacterium]